MKTLKPFGHFSKDILHLSFCDLNSDTAHALASAFAGVAQVEVIEGNLLDLSNDAIVSPANSFGDMSGGIDKHIDDLYKGAAQKTLMAVIADQFFGELPVGMAVIAVLPNQRFPFLVAAPTMRTPGSVIGTINAYLSMRAALVSVLRHNQSDQRTIHSVAVPGLCTGVGGMAPTESAEQMRTAFDHIINGGWRKVFHPAMAPYALRLH